MNKIFIPLICYNRTCHADYMISMMKLISHMHKNGIDGSFYPIFFDSLISRARNAAAAEFLDSDCTHLLFIDSDITFEPEDVLKLISSNKEVIGAPYPKKYLKFENFKKEAPNEIVDFAISGSYKFHTDKILEMDQIATGFLLIKKNVFKELISTYPDLEYINDVDGYGSNRKMWDFFKVGINKTTKIYESEDWGFCTLWKKMGGKIFARNDIKLGHFGWFEYKGDFNNWLVSVRKI